MFIVFKNILSVLIFFFDIFIFFNSVNVRIVCVLFVISFMNIFRVRFRNVSISRSRVSRLFAFKFLFVFMNGDVFFLFCVFGVFLFFLNFFFCIMFNSVFSLFVFKNNSFAFSKNYF